MTQQPRYQRPNSALEPTSARCLIRLFALSSRGLKLLSSSRYAANLIDREEGSQY